MVQVGITGGIGSGKTLVCSILERLGVPIYYADMEARRLMTSNRVLRERIIGLLGEKAYRDGDLDRKFVGEKIFGDRFLLENLNSLVHPVVREDYRKWAEGRSDAPYVVEEAAILFESGAGRFLDLTVLVYAPADLRIRRVMERDGVAREIVEQRMLQQMDEEEKRTLADEEIVNDERQLLLPQVVALHEKILNRK